MAEVKGHCALKLSHTDRVLRLSKGARPQEVFICAIGLMYLHQGENVPPIFIELKMSIMTSVTLTIYQGG